MRANLPLPVSLFGIAAVIGLTMVSAGCQTEHQKEVERRREEQDRSSAAFKAGQAAREIAREAAKVGAAAGRELDEGARKAREGWKAQERKERDGRDQK